MTDRIAIYMLFDPEKEDQPMYIGQSKQPAHRYGSHISSRTKSRSPVAERIRELMDHHMLPRFQILRWVATVAEARAIEDNYITRWPDLLNLRANSGWRHSEATRGRMRSAKDSQIWRDSHARLLEIQRTPEFREKMRKIAVARWAVSDNRRWMAEKIKASWAGRAR